MLEIKKQRNKINKNDIYTYEHKTEKEKVGECKLII
jgi:hypothetical protein